MSNGGGHISRTMKDDNLAVPLNSETAALLTKLFRGAEAAESSTVQIISCPGRWPATFDMTISGMRRRAEDFEEVTETVEHVTGQPMLDLAACGYLLRHEGTYVTLNYQLAHKRVKYESASDLGKRWIRATNDWGRFVLDLAAGIAGLWAVADMIRMLAEAIKQNRHSLPHRPGRTVAHGYGGPAIR
jgi:hypothetical protein